MYIINNYTIQITLKYKLDKVFSLNKKSLFSSLDNIKAIEYEIQ